VEPVTQLDPSIVERYAEHLARRASARIIAYTIVCALFGALLGSVPLVAPNRVLIPHVLGLALLLIGAAAGGYLGYTIGVRRAEGLRLQAKVTLHQLQVELMLVQPLAPVATAPAAPAPVTPAPSPAPPAQVAPAPVAPAPVAPAPVAPAPVAPAPTLAPPAPLPAAAAPVAPALPPVAPPTPPPTPAPVATPPLAPPALRPAMPPLSAPASTPDVHAPEPVSADPTPVDAAAAQPLAVAPVPALSTVPRLVEAPPASPPVMMPPLSAER
jgi:hypothetical protein